MEDTKDLLKEQYLSLRAKLDRRPKYREFLALAGVNKRMMERTFGSSAFSKLQKACGDTVNRLQLERTSREEIFGQYGALVRKLGALPTEADWSHHGCTPSADGLRKKPHNIPWSEMPGKFLVFSKHKETWDDVRQMLQAETLGSVQTEPPKHKDAFDKLAEIIAQWKPNRRRNSEEGYKVELRDFLERNTKYVVHEETGDSKVDLLVNRKYAIELKKGPTLTEYDRLFGQMARHLVAFGHVIAVVCDVSSMDRHRQFLNNVRMIYEALEMNIIILEK